MSRGSLWLLGISGAALCIAWALGVRLSEADLTDWHVLDPGLLRTDLLRSLYYLHAQPPLLNLIVGLALKAGRVTLLLTVLWSACAVGAAQCTRSLGLELGASPRLAFAAGALVAIAPSTLLYTHHVGPEMATAAALIASVLYIARGRMTAGFVLLGIGCLLRSLLVPPVVLIALMFAGRRALKPALAVFALLLVLCAKNAAIAGVFSTSSWAGLHLARVTVARLTPAQRAALSPFAQIEPFTALPPVAPTGIPVLDEPFRAHGAINFNNLAYARASAALMRDDLRAIAIAPVAVLKAWAIAWLLFFRPSDDWHFVAENRNRLGLWATFWDRVLCLEVPLPLLLLGQTEVFLTLLLGIPLVFALSLRDRRTWTALALVACVAFLSNMIEVNENYRYRFLCGPLCAALAAAVLSRYSSTLRSVWSRPS